VNGEASRSGKRSAGPRRPDHHELESALRFFRQWLRDPRSIAALAPSGRELAGRMALAIGRDARTVVELGGGTGSMTCALLERGILPERLLVLERNQELHAHLAKRFPVVEVVLANAADLVVVVRESRGLTLGKVDAVASSLGLLSMSPDEQRQLLLAAFEVLRPSGRFVQFTYAPRCPVSRALRDELGLEARRDSWSLLNLPPAFVYVLRRSPAKKKAGAFTTASPS